VVRGVAGGGAGEGRLGYRSGLVGGVCDESASHLNSVVGLMVVVTCEKMCVKLVRCRRKVA
jgi:hypothetical protein